MEIESSKKDLCKFLEDMHGILLDKEFDASKDLYMILTAKNKAALLDLEFNILDVVEVLKSLTEKEYSHTLLDRGDSNPPLLYVFGKKINDKCLYIKIKIKGELNNKVLCLSFHYAEYDLKYPYM